MARAGAARCRRGWPGAGPGQPPRERLRAYASWCNAVEGNTTFYATPAKDTVASWAEQTSASFRFILKMPRTVTHERRGTFVNDTPGRWTPGGGDRCRVLPNALSDRLKSLKVRRAN
jgi:hypothetical protein